MLRTSPYRPPRRREGVFRIPWLSLLLVLMHITACRAWLSSRARPIAHTYPCTPTTSLWHGHRGRLRPTASCNVRSPLGAWGRSSRTVLPRLSWHRGMTTTTNSRTARDHDPQERPRKRQDWSFVFGKKNAWQPQRRRRWISCGVLFLLVTLLFAPSSALANTATTAVPSAAASTVESLVEPTLTAATTTAAATTNTAWACLEAPVPASVELQLMFRLWFASLLGGCVGKERSSTHQHSAGVRTMALVALGACAFTIGSSIGFSHLGGSSKCDPSRMASNVASGVGFVGAGVITTSTNGNDSRQSMVHGLTTATAIWISAAIGVSCGVGLLYIATFTALSTVTILRIGRLQKKLQKSAEQMGEWWSHKRQLSKLEQQEQQQQQQQPKSAPVHHRDYEDLLSSSESSVTTHTKSTSSSGKEWKATAPTTVSNSTDTAGNDDDFDSFWISTETYEGDDDDQQTTDAGSGESLPSDEQNRMDRFVADFHNLESPAFTTGSGHSALSARQQNNTFASPSASSSSSASSSIRQQDQSTALRDPHRPSFLLERNNSDGLKP